MLFQIDQWCKVNEKANRQVTGGDGMFRDGHWWMFSTVKALHSRDLSFMSHSNIERTINGLVELGLLERTSEYTDNYPINKNLWYRVNYDNYQLFHILWEKMGQPFCDGRGEEGNRYEAFLSHWETPVPDFVQPNIRATAQVEPSIAQLELSSAQVEPSPSPSPTAQVEPSRTVDIRQQEKETKPSATPQAASLSPVKTIRGGDPLHREGADIPGSDLEGDAFRADMLAALLVSLSARRKPYISASEMQKLQRPEITFFDRVLKQPKILPGPYALFASDQRDKFVDFIKELGVRMREQRNDRPPSFSDLINAVLDYGRADGWWRYQVVENIVPESEAPTTYAPAPEGSQNETLLWFKEKQANAAKQQPE